MSQFITKWISNTLYTMDILQQQGHASTNLCPWCGTVPETIYHLYRWTHEGSLNRWTVSLDTFAEMTGDAEHGPQHHDYFCQCTPIHLRRSKWPATMSKCSSTLLHPLHRLVINDFRFHSQIPCTYTTDTFHTYRKRNNGIQMGQPNHQTNL